MTTRGTRPKKTQETLLSRARVVFAVAHQHLADFKRYAKGRSGKNVDAAYLKECDALHVEARTAVGGAGVDRRRVGRAAVAEQNKRDALFFAIQEIRDDVAIAHPDKTEAASQIRKAFGEGQPLLRNRTESLRAVAAAIEQSYEDAELAHAARGAGVTPKRIGEITILRRDLTEADTATSSVKAQKLAATVRRIVFLRELADHVAFVLRVAKRIFKSDPAQIDEFYGRRRKQRQRPAGAPRGKKKKKKTRGAAAGAAGNGKRKPGGATAPDAPNSKANGSPVAPTAPAPAVTQPASPEG